MKCVICGKEFVAKWRQQVCSQECAAARDRVRNLQRYHKRHEGLKPTVKKCANCGKEFKTTRKNKKYCNKECAFDFMCKMRKKTYGKSNTCGVRGKVKYKKTMSPALEAFFTRFASLLRSD